MPFLGDKNNCLNVYTVCVRVSQIAKHFENAKPIYLFLFQVITKGVHSFGSNR